jgi:hypothetical protein
MTKRITVYVGMNSIAGSTEEYVLDENEIPAGWDEMTDDQKSQPIVQAYMDNVIEAGWGEN